MDAPTDIRSQLQTLRIPKDQRPESRYQSARRRGWTRRLVVLALLFAAGAGAYVQRERLGAAASRVLEEASSPVQVPTITVTARTEAQVPPVLMATGKIVSDHQVQVSTKVSGQVVALFFEQGDRVKQGQRLALIEDVIYRARRDQAAAELEKARARLAFDEMNHARAAKLYKDGSAPEIEFVAARRDLEEARAQVAAFEAALAWAEKTLKDCEVVAPIEGVILERHVEVGDFVAAEGGRGANANAQFGTIADMETLRVEVDISELDVARLRKDMPCTIAPEAYKDRRYDGFVLWIDPGANYSKATVQVKVRILEPDAFLRVEGSAQVAFHARSPASQPSGEPARVWIPAMACLPDGDGATGRVFIVEDGRLRSVPVNLGRRLGAEVEVLRGLEPGERIATGELKVLRDGQRVGP